jgi:hypothetical protein
MIQQQKITSGKRHSEGEQEVDNETATKYSWQTIKKKEEERQLNFGNQNPTHRIQLQ